MDKTIDYCILLTCTMIVPFILVGAVYLLGLDITTTDHGRNCCSIYVVPSLQVRTRQEISELCLATLWGLFKDRCMSLG